MFDHDVTMELIRRAQQGDEQAKTRLIEENTPLLKSIIRRYVGKGVEYDDLFQISSVGLLKACLLYTSCLSRGVAQFGSARGLGPWGREFESLHPDQISPNKGL